MAATPTTLRLEQALRDLLDGILDDQTRDLVAAWALAWDEVAPDLADTLAELAQQAKDGHLQRGMLVRSQRLAAASAIIADRLDDLAARARVRIVGDLPDVVRHAYQAQRAIIGSQLPEQVDQILGPGKVHDRALDAIVARSTQQITSLTRPLSDDAYAAVRRELIRGVAVGSSPVHTAKRIVARAEQGFNGGLARAVNIARTETVDAHRAAAAAGQDEHAEVLTGWVWLAHLSDRTCQACLGMHGTVHPLSEPGPLGHQQCRCARQPRTKSWAELGINLPEPIDRTPDANAFFQQLTVDQQKAILGEKGYEAWLAGDFPRDAWAVRRENDGWRDAYYAAKPAQRNPHGAGGGAAGPPPDPPAPPTPDPDDWPIGPVLGDADQQKYHTGDDPLPDGEDFRVDSAEAAFTYVPDPDDRAVALLQYDKGTEDLIKRAAVDLDLDDDPPSEWHVDAATRYARLAADPDYGITDRSYTLDDFETDLISAARRLLAMPRTPQPLLFRGLRLPAVVDLADGDEVRRLLGRILTSMWFASATEDRQLAAAYARLAGTSQWTPVVLVIDGADGVRLRSVGRMSSTTEVLLTGSVALRGYAVVDGVFYVEATWRP